MNIPFVILFTSAAILVGTVAAIGPPYKIAKPEIVNTTTKDFTARCKAVGGDVHRLDDNTLVCVTFSKKKF